ncbi:MULTISPECIES: hypothetical protein [unclassified Micromonospora]|uniref:hypothetical protein n=1 Tax=unclassified Micromonospora TaxID=2617518 RepID=UPI001C22EBB0|nr:MULTISPECIES: hypothetical protein [unclassified Micromonospora]MBU8859295.1 hypothetical protein [Micromonospora sp. WMMB482]MDM4778807.1 hypothetical protein [Micromonospora sp. b486]
MTNAGDDAAAVNRAAPRRGGPVTTGVVLVAGVVALGVPALAVGMWATEGERDFQDVVGLFLVTAVPALVGAGAALLLGRRLVPRMRPSPASPAAAVRDALRAGRATDPAVDAAARREARRRLGQRWQLWLYLGLAALQTLLLAGGTRWSTRLVASVLIALWSGTAWLRWRELREARRYLAVTEHSDTTGPGTGVTRVR